MPHPRRRRTLAHETTEVPEPSDGAEVDGRRVLLRAAEADVDLADLGDRDRAHSWGWRAWSSQDCSHRIEADLSWKISVYMTTT